MAACSPTVTPQVSRAVYTPTNAASLSTPIEGTQILEACGFTITHPLELVPDGQGYQVMLQSKAESAVWVLIRLRHRDDSEGKASLETLALHLQIQYFPEISSLMFEAINVTDNPGKILPGLQRDLVKENMHTRLMVVVRSDTLLADQLPADVIYELAAQAPEAEWSTWGPLFDAMFRSLQPRDCGGV
jgi:hypothetical protein